ncbi:MAG TPA: serine--tRNA ligase, partial [Candidatus Absconditabacterales bacterium]|nr:serine--tRNA ligase [Candidatus Absconditabacterales bacterium]
LIQWALKKLQKKGFQPTIVPNIVRKDAMMSTGYLPYGEESIYKIMDEEGQQQYLIGTSEVTLVAQHSDEMIDENQLPLRYGGFSPCYRGEAGTYGKDTKGMIRVHQFEKVEMVSFVKPEDSEKEHQLILAIEEEIFQELKIPYRRLLICTGDLGVPAAKKYDLEAWFPGLGTYKEVTSCSNCTDFQARRAQIKYKTTEKKEFLHTLNGTAVAVSRTLAAIVENYQQADGSIMIPEVLQPYFEGKQTM